MRKHSACIHNPCCYINDGGTESSASECCFPQCRNHPKKKRSHSVNIPRQSKRKDTVLQPKHFYGPCYSSLKCNRTRTQLINYGKGFSRHDFKKYRHKSAKTHGEVSSYDIGSISSHCSSKSVDISHEMDAVNKEIEALLARYETAVDKETVVEIGPRLRMIDKGRHHKHKKENLTPELIELLSMDKPPLDKLNKLPYEYVENLKPRPPPSHLHKENIQTNTNTKSVKKELKESFEAFIHKEQSGENNKSELLESMWKDVVERGFPKDDLHKNIKPIYTSMTLDENASVNINLGKPPLNQESDQNKRTSVGTVVSPRIRNNPSVATQTLCDHDTTMNRIKPSNNIMTGSSKKIDDYRKKNNSDCSPDPKNWTGIIDVNIGDSEENSVKKPTTSSPMPQVAKPSGDASANGNGKEMLTNLLEHKIDTKIKPKLPATFSSGHQRELNVYTVQTPDAVNVFKETDWYSNNIGLSSTNSLLSKKQTEININEKLISLLNRTTSELFAKGKDKAHVANKDKLMQESGKQYTEEFVKGLPQFNCHSKEKSMRSFTDKNKDCCENIDTSIKVTNKIRVEEDKMMSSFLQSVNPEFKYMKENCDGMETPLCVEIIKRLTDTMIKCEPGKISDELTTRNCYLYLEELRKLRAQHLRHIQNEVKHIEELDKFLNNIGISAQLFYTAANLENKNNAG